MVESALLRLRIRNKIGIFNTFTAFSIDYLLEIVSSLHLNCNKARIRKDESGS